MCDEEFAEQRFYRGVKRAARASSAMGDPWGPHTSRQVVASDQQGGRRGRTRGRSGIVNVDSKDMRGAWHASERDRCEIDAFGVSQIEVSRVL